MISYATVTGTRKNVAVLRDHGWGFLYSAAGWLPTYSWIEETGIEECCGDSGAWHYAKNELPFDEGKYRRFVDWIVPLRPRFLMLPDIVGAGRRSLDLSLRWLAEMEAYPHPLAIVVQDGMEIEDVEPLLGPRMGLCVGGTTEWKLETMPKWCATANRRGAWAHVCRVNTQRRVRECERAGASSYDGTSGSKYSDTVAPLERARKVQDIEGYLSRNPA